MNASMFGAGLSRRAAFAAISAGLLTLGLAGCGGSSDNRTVVLPPGGVAVGNVLCTGTAEPPTSVIAHGQTMNIRFTLTDANIHLPISAPVAFDVVGGSLLNSPTQTDANGVVVVTFAANDPTFVGAGRVRLVHPEARLDCDVSFTVFQPACILRSTVLNGADAVVTASDACGSTEANVERHFVRKIRYRVTRVNPVTGLEEPVAGADIHLQANGLTFTSMDVGPTNANGELTQPITPFATGTGTATVTADVIRADVSGPNGTPDGVPDTLPCNTCAVSFQIINPICDANGGAVTPVYRSAAGAVKAAPLRPGESADLTATFVVDGIPEAGRGVLVDAADGFINGSANPVHVTTNGAGAVTVTYTARDGFSGLDTVTFQDDVGTLLCTQTASVSVVTCDMELIFGAPVTAGSDVPLTVHVLNVDATTAMGETVALDVTGGWFSQQPPYYVLVDDGSGLPSVMTTLHVTPGFSGPAQLSLSFVTDYRCQTITKPFTVSP